MKKTQGKRRKSEPCTDFFFMSGQCKLCALIGGQRNFSHTKEQTRCPPSSFSSAAPNPFYLVPLWPQEFHQICSQCRPIFRAGGCAVAVAAEAALEITSINFRLIFIFISYSDEEIFFRRENLRHFVRFLSGFMNAPSSFRVN